MLFCFFKGIHQLIFLANRYKNLKIGKTLSSFFKNLPNIFSQNFVARKLAKGKFIPVLFSRYFFTMLMTSKAYKDVLYKKVYKTFLNNQPIKYNHQETLNHGYLWSERIFYSFKNFLSIINNLLDISLFKFLSELFHLLLAYAYTNQLSSWGGVVSNLVTSTIL